MPRKRTALQAGAVITLFTAVAATTAAVGAQGASANNSAFALSATGLLTIQPVPYTDTSNGSSQRKSLAEFATPDKSLRARVLNSSVTSGNASSSATDLDLKLDDPRLRQARLTASAVRAECSQGSATASLADATVAGRNVLASPPPNTEVPLPGAGSVVLNKQTKKADGSTTVTAVHLEVNGLQKVDIATVQCSQTGDTAPPKPAPPKPAPPRPSHPQPPADAPRPQPVKGHLPVTH